MKADIQTLMSMQLLLKGRSDIVLKEGYPLSSFWSYSFAGLDGKTGEALFNLLDIPEKKNVADK